MSTNKGHSKAFGDGKGVVETRRWFPSGGYYGHLLTTSCALGAEYAPSGEVVLNSGRGKEYYTTGLREVLSRPPLTGIDLSRSSVCLAVRRVPEGGFAVVSAHHLPLVGVSVGLVFNCPSSLILDESWRVFHPGRVFLHVVPATNHLWELKQVFYDQPYRDREEDVPCEGSSHE